MQATALGALLAAALFVGSSTAAAPAIEEELVLITPVGKSLTDPALAEFRRHAKRRWGVDVKASALSAGTPDAYGRIVEWGGRPQADLIWGGEGGIFEKLAERKLLAPLELPAAAIEGMPATIGAPRAVALRDPNGFWIGTMLESTGIAYHPRLLRRLGVAPPKDWDDLLDPKLKGHVVQAPPTRSSSSHSAYEIILQRDGEARGWAWLKRLAANTGFFAARSRDVPSLVAKGEFAVGFAVPSYFAFEERLAGFDIRYVAPATAWITPGPAAILAGARHPKAARAFIEFMLSDAGQKIAMERGLLPIFPRYRIQGAPGSTAELAVEFNGGVRSHFDRPVTNVYDEALAQRRFEQVNAAFRREIEAVADELRNQPQEKAMTFRIESAAFAPDGAIPPQYTCEGRDLSPPLAWSGAPAGTKSLALIVDDPDAPDPAAPKMTWVHWVLYGLDPQAGGLPEGVKAAQLPAGTREGTNDWKRTGYGGPCPPIGRHRYFHKLYALDTVLPDLKHPDKASLERAMKGHVLAEAVLVGTYRKGR